LRSRKPLADGSDPKQPISLATAAGYIKQYACEAVTKVQC
jgi:hypothetical protein